MAPDANYVYNSVWQKAKVDVTSYTKLAYQCLVVYGISLYACGYPFPSLFRFSSLISLLRWDIQSYNRGGHMQG